MSVLGVEMPIHDRLELRKAEHAAVTHFLNWIEETGKYIGFTDDNGVEMMMGPRTAIAEYFEIDAAAYEAEKRALLEAVRAREAAQA